MKLIDADELASIAYKGTEGWPDKFDDGVLWILDKIDNLTTIDAVPVVRCRDCKNSQIWSDPRYRFCEKWRPRWNSTEPMLVDDEDYCAWGQRREDGDGDG